VLLRTRGQRGLEIADELIQLLRRAIDVECRRLGIGRKEKRESVRPHLDVRVVLRIGTSHMHARKIDCDGHAALRPLDGPRLMVVISFNMVNTHC